MRDELEQKYGASVVPVNCEQMKPEDIHEIMRQVLYEFPITEAEFYIPKWVEMLSREHRIKKDLLEQVRSVMTDLEDVRSIVAKEMNTGQFLYPGYDGGADRDGYWQSQDTDPVRTVLLL